MIKQRPSVDIIQGDQAMWGTVSSVQSGTNARSDVGRTIAGDANEKTSIYMAVIYLTTHVSREAVVGQEGQNRLEASGPKILVTKREMLGWWLRFPWWINSVWVIVATHQNKALCEARLQHREWTSWCGDQIWVSLIWANARAVLSINQATSWTNHHCQILSRSRNESRIQKVVSKLSH